MTADTRTEDEIREQGLSALQERLGLAGTIRFLQQFNQPGRDYTRDRHLWLDKMTMTDIVEGIKELRRDNAFRSEDKPLP